MLRAQPERSSRNVRSNGPDRTARPASRRDFALDRELDIGTHLDERLNRTLLYRLQDCGLLRFIEAAWKCHGRHDAGRDQRLARLAHDAQGDRDSRIVDGELTTSLLGVNASTAGERGIRRLERIRQAAVGRVLISMIPAWTSILAPGSSVILNMRLSFRSSG